MALETGSFISDLVATNPPSTDDKRQGDDHLRLIKGVLKTTFPSLDGPVTAAPAELNRLDSEGITLESTSAVAPSAGEVTVFRDGSGQLAKIDGTAPYNSAQPIGCPIGVILPFLGSGASLPPGWLFCDGAEVSRTTYANLFAIIGTTWGVGNGSTTFNIPALDQTFPVGGLVVPDTPDGEFEEGFLSSDENGPEIFFTKVNWIIKF